MPKKRKITPEENAERGRQASKRYFLKRKLLQEQRLEKIKKASFFV